MKRYEMIKDKNYFSNIIKYGKFNKDKNYVIYYKDNDNARFSHFGIAIKNSIGKAVIRNKLKRQTRSIVDNYKLLFKNNKDYIIMIREGCLYTDFDNMSKSVEKLLRGIK